MVAHPSERVTLLGPTRQRGEAALPLTLDRAPQAPPLYRQIQDGVRSAVLTGSLGAGMRLPPERELAAALGVNRTTVMHAYQELVADGVVEARPGRGTTVCPPARPADGPGQGSWPRATAEAAWLLGLPPVGHGGLGPDPGMLRDIAALGARPDVISFAGGVPGHDLTPHDEIQAALRDELAREGPAGLTYAPVEGLESLRQAIAAHLGQRGIATTPDEIIVVAGATQGMALVAQTLIEPGDEVVVEAPTYVGALQTLGAAGARMIGVPVDDEGMRVDMLGAILARRRVRLILAQPTLHNPTGATLTPARRERLLALARRHGVPILEDDVYGELWHQGPDPRPLKAGDRNGMVLHLGTFSKTVAPGLRVGWIAAPTPVIARLALAKQFADLNTGGLGQLATLGLLRSGAYGRHLGRVRSAYAERRAAMIAALRPAAPYLEITAGADGGFYLWCRLLGQRRARVLVAAAGRAGVALLAGESFYPPGAPDGADGRDRVRLSFSGAAPAAIAEGIGRLIPLLRRPVEQSVDVTSATGLRPLV